MLLKTEKIITSIFFGKSFAQMSDEKQSESIRIELYRMKEEAHKKYNSLYFPILPSRMKMSEIPPILLSEKISECRSIQYIDPNGNMLEAKDSSHSKNFNKKPHALRVKTYIILYMLDRSKHLQICSSNIFTVGL